MIAKHSLEQSQKGEGVEVVENKPHEVKTTIVACTCLKNGRLSKFLERLA